MKITIAKGAWTAFLTFLFCAASNVHATQIIYVNQNAPASSTGDGSTWGNAFKDLQPALAVAIPTNGNTVEVWVAAGTYKPTTGTNRSASFVLKSHLRILGGFRGNETNDTQRPYSGFPTVLSGDIGVPAANALNNFNVENTNPIFNPDDPGVQDNCYNVLLASNVTDVVLEKLYITGGYANVPTNTIDDTALLSMCITPGPTNSAQPFLGNTILPLDSRVAGGGLCILSPLSSAPPTNISVILSVCVFLNNGARGYGGGVAVKDGTVQAYGNIFQGNYAGQEGGAYWGMNSRSDFLYTDFNYNRSDGAGGALVFQSMPTDYTVDPFHLSDDDHHKDVADRHWRDDCGGQIHAEAFFARNQGVCADAEVTDPRQPVSTSADGSGGVRKSARGRVPAGARVRVDHDWGDSGGYRGDDCDRDGAWGQRVCEGLDLVQRQFQPLRDAAGVDHDVVSGGGIDPGAEHDSIREPGVGVGKRDV